MADKPIIFSAPMIRALLDGRKTQTRRVLKPQPPTGLMPECFAIAGEAQPIGARWSRGDRLWVREAWRSLNGLDGLSGAQIEAQCREAGYKRPWGPVHYEADGARDNWIADPHTFGTAPGRYRHARFMPRWASRLTLIVTDVRVQRLHDISEDDARAEGCEWSGDRNFLETPSECYRDLWNSLHGQDAWKANPWICALTFTVHHQNIDRLKNGDAT